MINQMLYENGNGGSKSITGNDIAVTGSLYTMIYIALFGGNVEADTKATEQEDNFDNSWWGNFKNESPDTWINSKTERVLIGADTTFRTGIEIKKAVKADLKRFQKYGDIEVDITFPRLNWIDIDIAIGEPENQTNISITWDATKKEAIINQKI